jgi:hypothetical protein
MAAMKVDEAFTALKQALIDELKEAKQEGARAFEESQFELAQSAAQKGSVVRPILEQIEALALQWQEGKVGKEQPPVIDTPEQALREAVSKPETQQNDYVMPILQALQELGGKGTARQVLDQIEGTFSPKVKNGQGGSNGWQLAVQTTSAALVKKGFISAESPEGEWKLTTKGRLYFFEQQ